MNEIAGSKYLNDRKAKGNCHDMHQQMGERPALETKRQGTTKVSATASYSLLALGSPTHLKIIWRTLLSFSSWAAQANFIWDWIIGGDELSHRLAHSHNFACLYFHILACRCAI